MPSVATAPSQAAVHRLRPGLAFRARLGSLTASWGATCAALDVAMLLAAVVATELGARVGGASSVPPGASTAFVALSLVLFNVRGLYVPRLKLDVLDDGKTLLAGTAVAGMAVVSVGLLIFPQGPNLVAGMARLWAFASIYAVAGRVALYWSQTQARRRGEIVSPTVIVGSGPVGRLVARRLLEYRDLGLLPIGFVNPDAEAEPARDRDFPIPVLGSTDEIERLVSQYDVSQVVVNCAHGLVDEDLVPMLSRCEELGVAVAFVPAAHEKVTRNLRVEHVGGLPLITAHRTDPRGWQFAAKYALDRLFAAGLVLLLSPVLVASAVAVWLTMGRPVLFRQPRVGLDGREFDMLKFRTMLGSPAVAGEADADWVAHVLGAPAPAQPVENRRTPVGSFLRRASLDELPQLLNVVRGDMSLVGPRPERTHYVEMFEGGIYRYGERHRVKSGVTGWAQVHGLRGNTSLEDRVEWDNWYIENRSLWLDLKILLLTAVAVARFFRRGE
jgi:exopolysaccharide biosynthesis polyprenyl glycosylphosphotransferase